MKMTTSEELPTGVLDAIRTIATIEGFRSYTLETKPLSGIGENSYGLVLQAKITCRNQSRVPFFCVIKIAPVNAARRAHMKVVEYYEREVFMYNLVFEAFREIQDDEHIPLGKAFDATPQIYFSSLESCEEFIIFEDLAQSGFFQNSRKNLPDYELTVAALKALATFHAMSFVLQAKRPQKFKELVNAIQFKDNLYTPTMDQVTIEFAKKYIRRTKSMLTEDRHQTNGAELSQIVQIFEDNFQEIALKAVNGGECAPYAVICHGDFWNNNILYRYDERNNPTCAKIIDFQMSRYASPILDVVHYLFACTEKDLRDEHFGEFLQVYYNTLADHLRLFKLEPEKIYPRTVLDSHVRTYGPYGFCMAIFALPFFISDSVDLPDLDVVSEAIHELSDEEEKQLEANNNIGISEVENKRRVLVEHYEMLNEKTIPIFKRRITGIVKDLVKYDMVGVLDQFCRKHDSHGNDRN